MLPIITLLITLLIAGCSKPSGPDQSFMEHPEEAEAVRLAVEDLRKTPGKCPTGNTYPPRKGTLVVHKALVAAAKKHAYDLLETRAWSHYGSDGSSPLDRALKANYPSRHFIGSFQVLENIAAVETDTSYGYEPLAPSFINTWLKSRAGHCDAIYGDKYWHTGVFVASVTEGNVVRYIAVQLFGGGV